ncbi:MAG: sugar transferase [bacterium]|nr:sugar transferase [bacterium]
MPNTLNLLPDDSLSPPASYFFIKRVIDITGALILAIVFFPVWIIVPILIKLDSPGPVFYTQKRVGLKGKFFTILKFRSMVANADEVIKQNPALWQKFQESDWKLENDPRITRIGYILRRLTLDELPQIINVLKGEMSLVGPRAYRLEEIKYQQKKHPTAAGLIGRVLLVKPGITGPWQTSGRNDIPFLERVNLDAQYALNHSILTDIKILFKTPFAMLSRW